MAENANLKYEQINWGWLNDYAGYKFAPITFFDNLYTEDGKSFKTEYENTLEDLKTGRFLVGRAQALATPNTDGSSTLIETSPVKPVYFNDGTPAECESIEINLTGNVNTLIGDYSGYTVNAGTFNGNTFNGGTFSGTSFTGNLTGNVVGNVNNDSNYNNKTVKAGTLVSTDFTTRTITATSTIDAVGNISSAGEIAGVTMAATNSLTTPTVTSDTNTLYLTISNDSGLRITSNAIHSVDTSGSFGKAGEARIYGAVWNDYAEFRDQYESIEAGYCVCSSDSGKVFKTMEKLSPCDGIVSDTYGFAIGDTDECRTPLAVAGRVLAYCEGDRIDYHAGDTVCASANGKVCKMTREEIREYPDRIVGVVSEIPQYEIWNNGIEVKGRIWVNVK